MGLTGPRGVAVETGRNMGTGMKLVLHTLIVFFATLAIAALVALGEPADGSSITLPPQATQPVASR
jgi:hypothetical protein